MAWETVRITRLAMKLVVLIFVACTGMLTSLILLVVLLSTPGVKASTTYSPMNDGFPVMITLGSRHTCEKGDWVFGLQNGYVGRIKTIVGDMAMCETYLEIRAAEFGSDFRIL